MSISADDLWRWRNTIEQCIDAQKPCAAQIAETDGRGQKERDEFLGATTRLEKLADELMEAYLDAVPGRRSA